MRKDKDQFNNNEFDFEQEIAGITFTDRSPDFDNDENSVNPDDYYSGNGKKKKKKRKKKRYLLKFLIFLLFVAAVILFMRSDFFNIDEIRVSNNAHYTQEQIIKIAGIKTGDNLFSFTMGGLEKTLMTDPYIETATVTRMLPSTIRITVKERVEKIAIPFEEKYIISDFNGMVLRFSDDSADLTIVNNLDPIKPTPGVALEVKDTQVLTDALHLLKAIEKADLYFIKISVSHYSVRGYIYESLIVEGSYENISANLDKLAFVIDDLNKKKIKRGTIKASGNGYYSFRPEI